MQDEPERSTGQVLTIPLFPLPNAVLFPRATLPLHIFEERYKVMTADALAGRRQIAMALLLPGWEKDYHLKPAIDSVVCVGNILSWEKLADGKYNFLLQGCLRAEIIREMPSSPYRTAEVRPIEQTNVLEIDLTNQRQRLLEMFCGGALGATAAGCQVRQILSSPISTSEAADLIAFNYIDNVELKQSLLRDEDTVRRVGRVIHALEIELPILEASCRRHQSDFSLN
ncbi:MAG: LON peptidase substrate-binding domain-containing protein [Planctomycetota bacterium]|nr:LON peptidase substrate-binding domain-containing protein [Planctomycetota bacterium]